MMDLLPGAYGFMGICVILIICYINNQNFTITTTELLEFIIVIYLADIILSAMIETPWTSIEALFTQWPTLKAFFTEWPFVTALVSDFPSLKYIAENNMPKVSIVIALLIGICIGNIYLKGKKDKEPQADAEDMNHDSEHKAAE